MKKLVMIAATALAVSIAAPAEAAQIRGYGTALCSQFNTDISANASAEAEYFNWLLGYISGRNFEIEVKGGTPLPKLATSDFEVPQQRQFVIDFCAQNPQVDYATAGDAIFEILQKAYALSA